MSHGSVFDPTLSYMNYVSSRELTSSKPPNLVPVKGFRKIMHVLDKVGDREGAIGRGR